MMMNRGGSGTIHSFPGCGFGIYSRKYSALEMSAICLDIIRQRCDKLVHIFKHFFGTYSFVNERKSDKCLFCFLISLI